MRIGIDLAVGGNCVRGCVCGCVWVYAWREYICVCVCAHDGLVLRISTDHHITHTHTHTHTHITHTHTDTHTYTHVRFPSSNFKCSNLSKIFLCVYVCVCVCE